MGKINTFKNFRKDVLIKLYVSLNVKEDVDAALTKFSRTDKVYQISGWVESDKISFIMEEVKKITKNHFYVIITDPKEIDGYSRGEIIVPVKLKKRKFWSNFEILVKNYGLPEYGEIDPTLIVAVTYLAMFGLMFGDVGQGFVFFALGILMKIKKIKAMNRFRQLGILFICMGTASMIFGVLYGSYFGMEHFIAPLFVNPMSGFMKIFLIAIAFGIVFMTVGILINIYNQFSKRRYFQAFFDKTGVFGLWFYVGVLTMAARSLIFKKPFSIGGIDTILLVLLPPILIVSREWIHYFIEKKHGHAQDGFGSLILVTFIEILETVIYYLGNTASFLRLGALSLAHASLSFAIYTMAGLLKGSLMGNIFSIVVIIFGNIFIIVLEGLVASIQTMRLQYYEFFSKFFSGTGKGFKPFKIEKVKKSI
jgi:V/A-type H+-transporting ATPase subunit I